MSIKIDYCYSLQLGVHLVDLLLVVFLGHVSLQLKGRGKHVVFNRHWQDRNEEIARFLQTGQLTLSRHQLDVSLNVLLEGIRFTNFVSVLFA